MTVVCADDSPRGHEDGDVDFDAPASDQPDGFVCTLCQKLIKEGMPVHMCRDASYCSVSCRRKGRRASANFNCGVSTVSSALSDTTHGSSVPSRAAASGEGAQGGVLRWILSNAVRKITSMVKGAELIRTLSSIQDLRDACAAGSSSHLDAPPCGVAGGSPRNPAEPPGRQRRDPPEVDLAMGFPGLSASADFVRLIEGTSL